MEPEEDREPLVFTPNAQPQYGPARWPEGPAEYRPGTRPPVNIEDLPPPEGAIFTPAVQPGGTDREQRNAFSRLAEFLGLRRNPEEENTIEMQGPGIGTAVEALFTAGEDLFMQVANAGPARIGEDYSLGDKLRDTGNIARELFNVTRFGDETPYETPYPEATPGERLFSGAIDPTDAARILTLLAPRNLKMFTERWDHVEYVPASILAEYSGNNLRRTPEEMEVLREEILANPEGLDDPIRVMFNDKTGTFLIGEGNHRVALAAEMGIPIPVVVLRSNWETPTSRPGLVPQDAMDRIKAFADEHHGYVPSNLSASEIGLPTVSINEIVDFIDRRAAAGDFPIEEAQQFREFAATYQPQFKIPGTTPRVIRGDETVSFDRPLFRNRSQ